MLPIGHWWALRKKFKQSIPGVVTDNYLATVLNMQTSSARNNILPYLKQLGIIDEDGKTGDRAKKWRDDSQYNGVCKEMLSEVYPQELIHAVPDSDQNRSVAERWFANRTGTGEVAARKMASLYMLLLDADVSKQPDDDKTPVRKQREDRPKAEKKVEHRINQPASSTTPQLRNEGQQSPPGININLQIHISADATPDQIEQIFSSMSKHIYHRG